MLTFILILDALFLAGALALTYESFREGEPRALYVGLAGAAGLVLIGLASWAWPGFRPLVAVVLGLSAVGTAILFLPGQSRSRSLRGGRGYAAADPEAIKRFDERETVFARNRSIPADEEIYARFYEQHPDWEDRDAARRDRGGPLAQPGSIDHGHRANVAMMNASFALPDVFGPLARPAPSDQGPVQLTPETAATMVKGWADRLGADLVGICRTDPKWVYSVRGEIHYGNWADWGTPLPDPLPYCIVIAVEMETDQVRSAPHTPAVIESGFNYAKGAFITTGLAKFIAGLGFQAVAQHSRNYDLIMPPAAVDAGLGELGRQGYLIADRFGPRVRLFAVTTDLPLAVDQPIDLGAEEFCEKCLKCAQACPSGSIPVGDKIEFNGTLRWKLDQESCFDYWGKVGTDCCICMAVCPFSRPDKGVHRLIRRLLKRSPLARRVLPPLDNFIYGRSWKPRPAPDWIDHRRRI